MPYNGEIIHFIGGIHGYIGELDQSKHPMGEGWVRIKNPCAVDIVQDNKTKAVNRVIARIWGIKKLYQKYVDIYCPKDSLKEIRVLDKQGEIYQVYQKELNRPDLNLIKAPTDGDIAKVLGGKGRGLN